MFTMFLENCQFWLNLIKSKIQNEISDKIYYTLAAKKGKAMTNDYIVYGLVFYRSINLPIMHKLHAD